MIFRVVLLIAILLLVGIFFRVDFVFYLLYLIAGVYLLALLWTRHALRSIEVQRTYLDHSFLAEDVQVDLTIRNRSLLPIPWVRIEDSLPIALSARSFRSIISLGPRQTAHLTYHFAGHKRGVYAIGPTIARTGDLFGFEEPRQRTHPAGNITVYPLILQITQLGLPSQSPFGTIASRQHIFQDPARSIGVRDYHAGDSLRHVNWKVSARQGRLQTRTFEPAISLDTTILLNLNRWEYTRSSQIDATERAIVIAASVAHHLVEQRQSVGLCTNGRYAGQEPALAPQLPSNPGRASLMRVLDLLAQVRMADTAPFTPFLRNNAGLLPWGSTLVVITGTVDQPLLEELFAIRQKGYHISLICAEPHLQFAQIRRQAEYQGIPCYQVSQLPVGSMRLTSPITSAIQ